MDKPPMHYEIRACLNLFQAGGLFANDAGGQTALDYHQQVRVLSDLLETQGEIGPHNQVEMRKILVRLSVAHGQVGNQLQQHLFARRAVGIPPEGATHDEIIVATISLCIAYMALGEFEKALEGLHTASPLAKLCYGEWGHKMGNLFAYVATCYAHLGDVSHYEMYRQEPIYVDKGIYGMNNAGMIPVFNWAATAALVAGNTKMTEDFLLGAIACQERYHPNNVDVAFAFQLLVILKLENAHVDEAAQYIEKAISILTTVYGEAHVEVAFLKLLQGQVFRRQRRFDAELAILSDAAAKIEGVYGDKHYKTAEALMELGIAHQSLLHHDTAMSTLERSLAIAENSYGAVHPALTVYLNNLANTYSDLKKHDLQIEMLQRALMIDKNHRGVGNPMYGATLVNLGRALGDVSDFPRAAGMLQQGVKVLTTALGYSHPEAAMARRFAILANQCLRERGETAISYGEPEMQRAQRQQFSTMEIQHRMLAATFNRALFAHDLTRLPPPNHHYIDRPDVMAEIHVRIGNVEWSGDGAYHPLCISGLPGTGKSQLAIAYAYQQAARYQFVHWIDVTKYGGLAGELYDLMQWGNSGNVSDKILREQMAIMYRTLAAVPAWLLIFANAPSYQAIAPYLPTEPLGENQHILITSEDTAWRNKVELGRLSLQQANVLIDKWQGNLDPKARDSLANSFACFPLAMVQAIGVIKMNPLMGGIGRYLSHYEEIKARLFSKFPSRLANQDKAHMTMTYEMAGSKLENGHIDVPTLLHLMGYMAPTDIPVDILVEALLGDVQQTEYGLEVLRGYGLVQFGASSGKVRVHALLQGAIRFYDAKMKVDAVVARLSILAVTLLSAFDAYQRLGIAEKIRKMLLLLPHYEALIEHFDKLLNAGETKTMYALDRLHALNNLSSIYALLNDTERRDAIQSRVAQLDV